MKNAKNQAEDMARAIDQKVVGLISADSNGSIKESWEMTSSLCACHGCDEFAHGMYAYNRKSSITNKTYTETINTMWEIA